MTPEREKLIRDHWAAWRHAWHATIGNEFKVDASKFDPPDAKLGGDNVIVLPTKRDILTFTRERHLGHYRIVCEGIVVEME